MAKIVGGERSKEKRFFNALKNIFIGVPVEGESGYINLMRMKSKYFDKVMIPAIRKEVEETLKPFPDFREELFDKLYTFFKRYFTESGSIGFFFTPYHQSVYERIYTNEQDVVLFWKTARLYYVKTDRLFRSMTVEVDGFRFFFDVSTLEHKRANEKRQLVFNFKERREDGTFVFTVSYSERGSKTKVNKIREAIKNALNLKRYTSAVPSEETLEKAFHLFERQSEVDYFICKDAKSFLREQFDLWLWQYVLGSPGEEPQTKWTETRIRQLQALKRIAYRVIDFIAAFEDELVKIWNKPKFVLKSGYVITLDRIAERDKNLLERIVKHPGFAEQVKEWRELGMVDESFTGEDLWERDITGKRLHTRYRFLPLDTKYFKDLELQIIGLFDDLDKVLDGWLIKSENYQALNTILPKFREKVQTIYIDPPYNTGSDGFLYRDRYQHSSWLTMMENRLKLARELMNNRGILFSNIDDHEVDNLTILLKSIFGVNKTDKIIWKKASEGRWGKMKNVKTFRKDHEYIVVSFREIEKMNKLREKPKFKYKYGNPDNDPRGPYKVGSISRKEEASDPNHPNYYTVVSPTGKKFTRQWDFPKEEFEKLDKDGRIYWGKEGNSVPGLKIFLNEEREVTPYSVLVEKGTSTEAKEEFLNILGKEFEIIVNQLNPKPHNLIKTLLQISSKNNSYILDFFAGSGTTAHAVMRLNKEDGGKRKFILVEMADYFDTVIIPRIKKVAYSFNWKGGQPQDTDGIGVFFKYYELEQYEDVLRRARYSDEAKFFNDYKDPVRYIFMRDLKMAYALEVDLEQGKVKVDLSKLYSDIDLAETLSNLTGKWIKRIHPDPEDPTRPGTVEFEDGTKMDLKNPDWRVIKPLIWW